MNLKAVLGDSYKDGMTFDEVAGALKGLDLVDRTKAVEGMVSKTTFDKTASDLATAKRQLKERMTQEEQEKLDRENANKAIMEELDSLRKKDAINGHLAGYLKLGYPEDLAQSTAEAIVAQDFATVLANQQAFLAAHDKEMQVSLTKSMDKRPPAGDPGTVTDYKKLAEQAAADGDRSSLAYYLRLAQEAK